MRVSLRPPPPPPLENDVAEDEKKWMGEAIQKGNEN